MNLDIDVLITYAEADNESASGDQRGWITQFKRFLEQALTQVQGSVPHIMLKGEFDSMTSPNLDNAGTLVCVLSPDFIKSSRCLHSLEAFRNAAQASDKNVNRIFKVYRYPVPLHEQPPALHGSSGYDMYAIDSTTNEIRDYADYFSKAAERQYWMKLIDLAYDINTTLSELKGNAAHTEIKKISGQKTIFLAETSYDLTVERNKLRRELERLGHIVLPTQSLPSKLQDFEREVRKALELADLSVHLIGNSYGEVPEGANRSVIELQNRFAAEKSHHTAKESFSRLIWITPALSNTDERQYKFIEYLRRDTEAHEGAEIVQTPIEEFNNIIREEIVERPARKTLGENTNKSIYVIHDKVDQSEVKPIIEVIKQNGYQVLVPEFEGQLLDIRQRHIENLQNFDLAIIYKGKVNDQWVRMKVVDLIKSPGFGRKKPIVGKAVFLPHNANINPDDFNNHDLKLVQVDPERPEQAIKSLLEEFTS